MSVNLAIIGLGRWGPNYVRIFSAMPECNLKVVVDSDPKALQKLKNKYPALEQGTDYKEVLSRDDIDAVIVVTPTSTHFEIVKLALQKGKHVLCEKPITNSGKDAWELSELSAEKQVQLMVGHIFLFNPGIEYLRKSIIDEIVGDTYYINAVRTNLGPFRSDVNAAWDLASHDIYILNYLLWQRPKLVSAVGSSYLREDVEDIVFLTLKYPGNVLGHIHVSWLDPRKVRQITVVGKKKMITWDEAGALGPIMILDRKVDKEPVYDTFGEFQLLAKEGDIVMPLVPAREPLGAQAQEFITRCQSGKSDNQKGNPEEAAIVVNILEAASQSLTEQGKFVQIKYGK
jgi:predicted dehydrogenase